MTMNWIWAGFALMAVVGAWGRRRLWSERVRRESLSAPTAALIWMSYLGHLGLTLMAALAGRWPLPLNDLISIGAGSLSVASGLVLFVGGTISFGSLARMSGTLADRLVISGMYRWSRNPQNAGWMAILLGASLLGRSGLALLLTAVFWTGFVTYVREEERQLEEQFGKEYRDYRERSHRYFGPPRRV